MYKKRGCLYLQDILHAGVSPGDVLLLVGFSGEDPVRTGGFVVFIITYI